jgi:hypothetical protein
VVIRLNSQSLRSGLSAVWIAVGLIFSLFQVVLAQDPASSTQSAPAEVGVQSSSYKISGHVGWVLRYGLGDGKSLSLKGYSTGFYFNQSIQLDALVSASILKPAPGSLSLIAQLDTSQPDFLQSVRMLWEAKTWKAEYGDFPMAREESPFAYASRLLKGIKVDWNLSDHVTLSGIHSQITGNLETKTFRGNTIESSITFSYHEPNQAFTTEPYGTSLNGLEYFSLGSNFVEGFTVVKLGFLADSGLRDFLKQYDLDYLYDTIAKAPESDFDPTLYTVIPEEKEYFLALNSPYLSILREKLFDLIDEYNSDQKLSSDQQKEYPFNQDTDFEQEFLKELAQHTQIRVDDQTFTAEESSNRRFYSLHVKDVQEDTLQIEVTTNGNDYLDVHDPTLTHYEARVFPSVGILEFQFPTDFFNSRDSGVKVTFSYQTGSGLYILGLTVLKESEKVYLNGRLLQRNGDYLMQYEEGALVLLNPLGKDDVLRVEYETARGGLLGFSDFGRTFNSLSLHLEPDSGLQLDIDLLQAHDALKQGVDPETLETMPNTDTVLGVSGKFQGNQLEGAFDLGVAQNRFPSDNNERANQPNFVHVIRVIDHDGWPLVLFGHRNGLTVFDGANWSNYGIREGLSGQQVYDIAYEGDQLVFATSGGLTILKLDPGNPLPSFARKRNWKSYDERDGVPGEKLNAVLLHDGVLWVGSDMALGQVRMEDISSVLKWKYYQRKEYPELPSDRILKLEEAAGWLYIGTDQGLAILDSELKYLHSVPDLQGVAIRDMAADGDVVYAATDQGVRALQGGVGVGWPVSDKAVRSVGVLTGELWYGTNMGLYGVKSGRVKIAEGQAITALAGAADAIWAGGVANENYQLFLYYVKTPSNVRLYQEVETHLSGRADHRFQDISPDGHTDQGLYGRLLLRKMLGDLHLEGYLEGVTPGFSPVGTLNRQDHITLNLNGVYPITPFLNLRATHQEGVFDRYHSPNLNILDMIEFAFTPDGGGPQIHIDSDLKQIDRDFKQEGFDQKAHSMDMTLQQSLFNNKLSVSLGYTIDDLVDLRRPVYSNSSSTLSGGLSFEIIPGLQLKTGYRLPSMWRYGEFSSQHQLDWQLSWNRTIPLDMLSLTLSSDFHGNARIPSAGGGDSTLTQNAQFTISSTTMTFGDLHFSPRLNFTAGVVDPFGSGSSLQWLGEGSLDGGILGLDGQLRYRRSFTEQQRNQLTHYQDSLSANLNLLDFGQVRPVLTFNGSLDTLLHPLFGRKVSGQYSVSLEMNWQSAGPLSADLLLSRDYKSMDKDQQINYSLQQTLHYEFFPGFTPSLSTEFDYSEGTQSGEPLNELDGQVTLKSDFEPMPGWISTVTSVYLFNLNGVNTKDSRNSFVVEFQFGRDFSMGRP